MKLAMLTTMAIALWLGLARVSAVADNGVIYMRQNADASVELSNIPTERNYRVIVATPPPGAATMRPAMPAISASRGNERQAPIAGDGAAPSPDSPAGEERKAVESPQAKARGYLESLLKLRGLDPASIHGIEAPPGDR